MSKDIERVMIFIEIVRGCNNKACPSYNVLCSTEDKLPEFMSEKTLNLITQEILNNKERLSMVGRVDIWAYGCGDTLLHPALDEISKMLQIIPFKKTVAIDSNCWRENTGWGNTLSPVILFKEGSFDPSTLSDTAQRWTRTFPSPRFGFILKTLTPEIVSAIRNFQSWWNYPFIKIRSFHHVPLGLDIGPEDVSKFCRPDIIVMDGLEIEDIPMQDKKAIRVMYRVDGSLRRCLVSAESKGNLSAFLDGDLSDCAKCWPTMAGEQILVFPGKILRIKKARCVSDKG
jgi:hypothetical protein